MNAPQNPNTYRSGPDENGRFGLFGRYPVVAIVQRHQRVTGLAIGRARHKLGAVGHDDIDLVIFRMNVGLHGFVPVFHAPGDTPPTGTADRLNSD